MNWTDWLCSRLFQKYTFLCLQIIGHLIRYFASIIYHEIFLFVHRPAPPLGFSVMPPPTCRTPNVRVEGAMAARQRSLLPLGVYSLISSLFITEWWSLLNNKEHCFSLMWKQARRFWRAGYLTKHQAEVLTSCLRITSDYWFWQPSRLLQNERSYNFKSAYCT